MLYLRCGSFLLHWPFRLGRTCLLDWVFLVFLLSRLVGRLGELTLLDDRRNGLLPFRSQGLAHDHVLGATMVLSSKLSSIGAGLLPVLLLDL
jgi:hypothetical protein